MDRGAWQATVHGVTTERLNSGSSVHVSAPTAFLSDTVLIRFRLSLLSWSRDMAPLTVSAAVTELALSFYQHCPHHPNPMSSGCPGWAPGAFEATASSEAAP